MKLVLKLLKQKGKKLATQKAEFLVQTLRSQNLPKSILDAKSVEKLNELNIKPEDVFATG